MPTVAALEIGQAPRPDLVAEAKAVLPDGVTLLEFGALDGIDPRSIPAADRHAANPLSTRLTDGRRIVVDEPWLAPHLQAAVRRAELAGADALLLLCAGGFAELTSERPLIRPTEAVARVLHDRDVTTILLVVPVEGQVAPSTSKWRVFGFEPVPLVASLPDGIADVVAAADRLPAVVLDYVGHARDIVDRLDEALRARTHATLHDLGRAGARAVAELLASDRTRGVPA